MSHNYNKSGKKLVEFDKYSGFKKHSNFFFPQIASLRKKKTTTIIIASSVRESSPYEERKAQYVL